MGSLTVGGRQIRAALGRSAVSAFGPACRISLPGALVASTASWCGAARSRCATTARSGAARSGTARSSCTALRSLDLAALCWLRCLAALSSRSFASDQGQCSQCTEREHDLTNHFELLARPRNIHSVVGRLRDAMFSDKLSLVRTGVYVDISSESDV